MRILFIFSLYDIHSSSKPLQSQEQMQFGISYISSFLRNHGHSTRLMVLSRTSGKKNWQIIDEYLGKFHTDLICFTAVSTEYQFIASIARYIKNRYPDIYLLVGGSHVSLNPADILSDNFDALCIGEGEYPALELVTQLEKGILPSSIANLWIKSGSEINRNPARPFLKDLDTLPFPDREMWQEWIKEQPESRYSILLGRGCPFECTYCCNHALKRLALGDYVRFRTPGSIVTEINELVSVVPTIKEIYLEVETIGVNIAWAIALCSQLESFNVMRSQPISFGVNLRIVPNADFESLFIAFKKANFRFINIGLESGSEKIRREVLKRNYSNKDIIDTVALARKYGLKVAFTNMIGLPNETLFDFEETVKINRQCSPDWSGTYIFFPYPGTKLWSLCKEQGLLNEPIDTEMERRKATLDLPGFSKKQIQNSYIWFDYNIDKGRVPIYKLLLRVLLLKLITRWHWIYYVYQRVLDSTLFRWLIRALR